VIVAREIVRDEGSRQMNRPLLVVHVFDVAFDQLAKLSNI